MKLLMIAATLSILFACGILIYTESEKHHFLEDLPKNQGLEDLPKNRVVESTQPFKTQNSKTARNTRLHPGFTFEQTEDRSDQTVSRPEPLAPDWLDTESAPEHSYDPWGDMLDKEQVIARGAYIEDPESMELYELVEAERQQLIERFGDIPEVRLYTSLKPRYLVGKLNFDEQITFLKAQYSLFPSESTRRSIVLTEWQKSREDRGVSRTDPTEADLEYLKSQGITVNRTRNRLTITTE